jgi:D-alanyl-D-alanine carboxypeptidase (penicillin-binding protein 5/6)
VQNRNALLWLYRGAFGVKTGFTTAAGYCLVAAAGRGDERLLAVVLGEPGQAWNDAAELLDFGFTAFDRREVIRPGDELEPVRVDGLEIPAVAGASVLAYVDRDDPRVRISFVPDDGLRFPMREGDRVGEALVEVRGSPVGRVPAVVGDLPPTPGEGDPLWLRVIEVFVAVLNDIARDAVADSA